MTMWRRPDHWGPKCLFSRPDSAPEVVRDIHSFRFNALIILVVHLPSKISYLLFELLPESVVFKVVAASVATRATAIFGWILTSGDDGLEGGHKGFFHVGEAEVFGDVGDLGRERLGEVNLLV